MGILIDSSSDVNDNEWNRMAQLAKDIVDSSNPNPTGNHIGVIPYGSNATTSLKFNSLSGDKLNSDEIKRAIDRISREPRGQRRLDEALAVAEEELFSYPAGARSNARRVTSYFSRCYSCLKLV